MNLKTSLIPVVAFFSLLISANSGFSQDQAAPSTPALATETQNTQEPQWVWAEVLSVDPLKLQMTVKYLDYETDSEKEMVINADDTTTYENIKSFGEIKPQDTLSIDYITTAEGKNFARNINLEKSEDIESLPEGAVSNTTGTKSPVDMELNPTQNNSSQE
jgi:hypothetical protein